MALHDDDADTDGDAHDREDLRRGQAEEPDGVTSNELDEKALDARQHQEPAEHVPARLRLLGHAVEHEEDRHHDEDLEDRRRPDLDARRRRHGAVGVRHPQERRRRLAVVAVARELAADAPDGVAKRHGRSHRVGDQAHLLLAYHAPAHDADEATDEAAVPGKTEAPDQEVEEVFAGLAPVLDDPVDARPGEAADAGGEDELVAELPGDAARAQEPPHEVGRHDERQRGHEAEAVEGERAEMEEDRIHESGECSPRSGRVQTPESVALPS